MGKMMLLIWEQYPETTDLYVIDGNINPEAYDWALNSAGKYINNNDDPADDIHKLNDWVMKYDDDGKIIHAQPKLDGTLPIQGPFDEVVICGWFL